MANLQHAKKKNRSDKAKTVKNLRKHRAYRAARKEVETAIKNEDKKAATTALSKFNKALGKASKKGGPLHKNTAARYMSRQAKKVDAAFNQQ